MHSASFSDLRAFGIIIASGAFSYVITFIRHSWRDIRVPKQEGLWFTSLPGPDNRMIPTIRNGPLLAVLGHGMIGASLVWDKVLLKNPGTKNLVSYVFWLGALSVFGVVLVPFGYKPASVGLMALAFGAGLLHLVAIFFYYEALKRGEASETLAVMGGFTPVATELIGLALLSKQLTGWQLIGFAVMTGGGFVMFFSERLPLKKLIPPMALSSGFFGLVNILEKIVYDHTNFVTGYVWFTIGTFAGAMALLLRKSWRKQIFAESGQDNPRNRFWYFVNRFAAGVGSFLIFYAISLTHPAVVSAIAGVRYGTIFFLALILTKFRPKWLKESFRGWQLVTKAAATLMVIAGVVLVGLADGKEAGAASTAMNTGTCRRHAHMLVCITPRPTRAGWQLLSQTRPSSRG